MGTPQHRFQRGTEDFVLEEDVVQRRETDTGSYRIHHPHRVAR
jgi:hypothetical protein